MSKKCDHEPDLKKPILDLNGLEVLGFKCKKCGCYGSTAIDIEWCEPEEPD